MPALKLAAPVGFAVSFLSETPLWHAAIATANDAARNSLRSKSICPSFADFLFYKMFQVLLCLRGEIVKKVAGNRHRYQLDPLCPIQRENKGIIIKTVGIAMVLEQALTEETLAKTHDPEITSSEVCAIPR
jgi:hypothetical protein